VKNLGQYLKVPSAYISETSSQRNFKFVGELKITILESASFTNNKSSSLLVFIGFKKFKTSLTSIEEGSLGNCFRLSLYSAWRKLVMLLGLRFSSLEANSSF
jgi:hypothetical protein